MSSGAAPVVVDLPVPADRAFGYLADPRNRPAWQSSLRAIADAEPDGSTWTDVTVVPGLRPRLRTTASEPPHRWAEEGRWGPVRADLELAFTESPDQGGCRVAARFTVHALGLGPLLTRIARAAIADDLRRAGRLLRDAD